MGIEAIERIKEEVPYHTNKLDVAIVFAKYATTASMVDWMINAGVEHKYIKHFRSYSQL